MESDDAASALESVTDVTVERDQAVIVTYGDDLVCRFPVGRLRAACPCASCRGWRERGEPAWPRPGQPTDISVVDAELTGAWGISITWNDGHDTGIYAWRNLRRWWDDGLPSSFTVDLPTR